MIPPFDIFKVESSGLRWMEAAPDLERAKTRVRVLSASSPGEYIILNQITGEKITIQRSPSASCSRSAMKSAA